MTLIKTIQELQQFVRVNISVMEKSFLPYENDAAEKYLRPYLGQELLDQLNLFRESDNTGFPDWADTQEKKNIFSRVLSFAQNALAKFTCLLAAPAFDLSLSEMGFVVQHNQTTTPASAERVKNFISSLESQGWDNMETLLRFLEKHHQVITPYKDSDAFVLATSNLINSAEVFDRYVIINASRLTFIRLRPAMRDIEILQIEPVISKALADQLKDQQRKGELSEANKKLLPLVQGAVAHLVAARELSRPKSEHFGEVYLAQARRMLDKSPESYPLYRESEQYIADKTGYALYDNNEESNLFSFSG